MKLDIETVIEALECCAGPGMDSCDYCPCNEMRNDGVWQCDAMRRQAAELLKAIADKTLPGGLSEQDMRDLDVVRRIRAGRSLKVGNRAYVIFNGAFYRKIGMARLGAPAELLPLDELLALPADEDHAVPVCVEERVPVGKWYNSILQWMDARFVLTDYVRDRNYYYNPENYGYAWRCWTGWPTREQREAIPWED